MTKQKNDNLPLRFRSQEVNGIFSCLRAGDSCQVVGIGSVGKSNLLHFLLREDVRRAKLGKEWKKHQFVYIDANKLLERTEWGLWELMLHQILACLSGSGMEPASYREIDDLYQRAAMLDARHIALRYLDRAVGLACKNLGLRLVFLFDEFDDLYRTLPSQAFDALRALRDDNKYNLMYITATQRELPRLRNADERCEAFEELTTLNTIWLGAYTKADARYALQRLASRHKVVLNEKQMRSILQSAGGHPGLIRAIFLAMQDQPINTPGSLLTDKRVQEECRRIWQSLAKDEHKALVLLSRTNYIPNTDGVHELLRQKGLLGGEWADSNEVFSSVLSKYIYEEKPAIGNRIRLDRKKREVWVDERLVQALPRLEYKLLEFMEARRGQVCSRNQIAQHLYPDEKLSGVSHNAIDSIVKRLRKHIEPDPKKPGFISTIHGIGFRLADGETKEEDQASKK